MNSTKNQIKKGKNINLFYLPQHPERQEGRQFGNQM